METCQYELKTIPNFTRVLVGVNGQTEPEWRASVDAAPGIKWGHGKFENPPELGTSVRINFNGLGTGIVAAYFVEHGWLGVKVMLDSRPDWHKKQAPDKPYALVFGAEIEPHFDQY